MTPPQRQRFDAARADSQERHGLGVAYVRKAVGPGTEYRNAVARAVISEQGGYYQLQEMPEEFCGVVGGLTHRLIGPDEARATLRRLENLIFGVLRGALPARALSLYALYEGGSLRERRGMFLCDWAAGGPPPFLHGALEADALPLFFKVRVHLDAPLPDWPDLPQQGILFFLMPAHTDAGQCLLAAIAQTPETVDLAASAPAKPQMMN